MHLTIALLLTDEEKKRVPEIVQRKILMQLTVEDLEQMFKLIDIRVEYKFAFVSACVLNELSKRNMDKVLQLTIIPSPTFF